MFRSIDIHDISDIDIDDISGQCFFFATSKTPFILRLLQDTFHSPSTIPKRFKSNINEELYQKVKVGNDHIFKKYLC